MNISTKLPISIFFTLAFSSATIAQTANESVILYNSQAVKVELSEVGKILTFYGLMPGYMEGYDLGETNGTELATEIADLDQTVDSQSFGKNAQYDIISKDRLMVAFPAGFATLSSETIKQLDVVAGRLKAGDHAKVLVTAYSVDVQSSKLVENRVNSVMSYLHLKGIANANIITEIQDSNSLGDNISINYVD